MTYYDKEFSELRKIKILGNSSYLNSTQSANMKLQNEFGQTRWISVSPKEIEQILAILNEKETESA